MAVLRGPVLFVAALLVAVLVPVATAAGDPDADAATGPTSTPSESIAPTPAASTATPSPSPSPSAPTPRIAVEPYVPTLSQYRYLGAWLSGIELPAGPLQVTVDGTRVATVLAQDGSLEELVRFPGIDVGEHRVELRSGSTVVAGTVIEVTPDQLDLGVSPRWITAQTLRSTGVRLSATGLEPGSTVLAQRVRPADDEDSAEPVVLAEGVADAGGRVMVTVTAADGLSTAPGSEHVLGLSAAETAGFSFARVRLTELSLSQRPDGSVMGTGFEPGVPVTLLVDDTTVTEATAADDGTVVFGHRLVGVQRVTLRSTAGMVTADLGTPLDLEALRAAVTADGLAAREASRAAARLAQLAEVEAIRRQAERNVSDALTEAVRLSVEQAVAVVRQVQAQQQLIGEFPKTTVTTTSPDGKDAGSGSDAKNQVVAGLDAKFDAERQTAERRRQVEDAVALKDARSEELTTYYEQVDEASADQLRAMQEATGRYLQQIREALTAMQQSQADRHQAIVRASTPEVVGVQNQAADALVEFAVPADFGGTHHVGLVDLSSGVLTAWQEFDVVAPAPAADAPRGVLPAAGAETGRGMWPLGLVLVLAGAATLAHGRRRLG